MSVESPSPAEPLARPSSARARQLYLISAGTLGVAAGSVWCVGTVSFSPLLLFAFSSSILLPGLASLLVALRVTGGLQRPQLTAPLLYLADLLLVFCAWSTYRAITLLGSAVLTPLCLADADRWLAAPEQLLGLTQRDLWLWFNARGAIPLLELFYQSIRYQVWFAFLYWGFAVRDLRPFWEMLALLMFTAAVGAAGYIIAPASGPYLFYAYGPETAAPTHLADWLAMRSGVPHTIERIDGYISFPSFHIVFAMLLTWLWRGTKLLWPAVLLNAGVIVSTWVVGWHYLADLFGGALLGSLCLAAWVRFSAKDV